MMNKIDLKLILSYLCLKLFDLKFYTYGYSDVWGDFDQPYYILKLYVIINNY
jgi:hypothetical protein